MKAKLLFVETNIQDDLPLIDDTNEEKEWEEHQMKIYQSNPRPIRVPDIFELNKFQKWEDNAIIWNWDKLSNREIAILLRRSLIDIRHRIDYLQRKYNLGTKPRMIDVAGNGMFE